MGLRDDLGRGVKWKSLPTESCAPSHPLQVSDSLRLSGTKWPLVRETERLGAASVPVPGYRQESSHVCDSLNG